MAHSTVGRSADDPRDKEALNPMPYRVFQDSTGTEWSAWDVVPRPMERRMAQRRTTAISLAPPAGDRRRTERRVGSARRSLLPERLSRGWLCFENRLQRRRLTPIPDDWARCPEPQLERYCEQATPVPAGVLTIAGRP